MSDDLRAIALSRSRTEAHIRTLERFGTLYGEFLTEFLGSRPT